ncbi:MAG TPA: hypothetical protein VM364_03745 [Vicinamibacterales bacterium]|nr:hypothetical protein [Vicinamibacterales bacterium]
MSLIGAIAWSLTAVSAGQGSVAPPPPMQTICAEAQPWTSGTRAALAAEPDDVLPRLPERVLRSLQVGYQITDNTDFVVAKVPAENGDANDDLIRNPDQRLWKVTYGIRLADWLLSPSEIADGYATLAAFASAYGASVRAPATWEELHRLARGRGWGVGSQLLSGLSGSVSWSRRPHISGLDAAFQGTDETIRTWDMKFDPAPLFTSAAARKAGYAALGSYLAAFGKPHDPAWSDVDSCKMKSFSDCVEALNSRAGAGLSSLLGTLLPTFEIKSLDEFDFRQVGGRFILPLPSQRESSLETYSFTWDLRRILNGRRTERANAIAAAKAHADVQKALNAPGFSIPSQSLRTPVAGEPYYARMETLSPVGRAVWTSERSSGEVFDGVKLAPDGVLYGTPRCDHPDGCTRTFIARVTDEAKRTAECSVTIRTVPSLVGR